MLSLDITPATAMIGLVVMLFAAMAVRRLVRSGTCDCRKGASFGKGMLQKGGCAGECVGCSKCRAADRMAVDMEKL